MVILNVTRDGPHTQTHTQGRETELVEETPLSCFSHPIGAPTLIGRRSEKESRRPFPLHFRSLFFFLLRFLCANLTSFVLVFYDQGDALYPPIVDILRT